MADNNNNNNITNTVTPSNPVLRTTRSDSTSSASTDSTVGSPPGRRSSYLFGGLEAQKRRTDPESIARRQSMNEQRPAAGFFGKMWNEYVRGK